jgi:alpha-L-arabinofuranosidase
VSTSAVGTAFDRRLLGTNIPAWVRPEALADPTFRQQFVASGATVVRMPGGSWSSSYDWLACENGDSNGCYWTWAARPTDFLEFMRATGAEGMWTVSFNGTAQEAAAAVAFFNGAVGDPTTIGVDRNGKDWGTVGTWAQLRADHGNPDPVPVRLWEVGNEVYGAKPDAGASCPSFGWEDVWTCDGDAYVQGDGGHDGFLAFRDAMQAVDPDIAVGAVGVPDPASWGDFGTKVIDGAGSAMDFYVVHDYAFNGEADFGEAMSRPEAVWGAAMAAIRDAFGATATAPVAATEYNLISAIDSDTEAQLTHVMTALYLADTIGQMTTAGVQVANQWNFANGAAENGSDYGMINLETKARYPQFYALAMWSRFGDQLLPVSSGFDATTTLSSYASSDGAGGYTVLTINKTADPVDATVRLDGATGTFDVTADVAGAESSDDASMSFNGVAEPPVDLSSVPSMPLGTMDGSFAHTFDPFSITVLRFTPAG